MIEFHPAPREHPRLGSGDVQVWRADIAGLTELADGARLRLSPEERERAARIVAGAARRSFAATRSLLRVLLGRYLHREPEALEFRIGPTGKPRLRDSEIKFSVSHSGALSLLAFSRSLELGVDAEVHRPAFRFQPIADQYYAVEEAEALRGAPAEEARRRFFDLWCRKEAVIKARELGIPDGLSDRAAPVGYRVLDLDLGPGTSGALAVKGKEFRVAAHAAPESLLKILLTG